MNTKKILAILIFFNLILLTGGSFSDLQAQEKEGSLIASRIMDADVYDQKHTLIGEVDDLIIRRSGKLKKLTVEFGGFIDIGDKLAAVSAKRFQVQNGKVIIEMTEQELNKKEEFDYYRRGFYPDYYYGTRTNPYRQPYLRYGYGPSRRHRLPFEKWSFSPARFLASTVIDRRLTNEAGEDIGWLEDLIINPKNKKVEKIIISAEDILGEDALAALPYKPLVFSGYGLIVYDISPADIKNMPRYTYPAE